MNSIMQLFNHYGYIVLFFSLTLELIAFPLPGEALMTYCGFLIFKGELNFTLSIIIAAAGVISGITLSYFLGKSLGFRFFNKYGSYLHLGPEKIEKTSKWFDKYGNRLLILAYFIPGVRHITGYFSGITKIPYRKFAANAYVGALLWTSTFISLGKILGPNWERFHGSIRKYIIIGSLILSALLITIYVYRSYKVRIFNYVINMLNHTIKIFHSLGRAKFVVSGVALSFLAFSVLVIGTIQDYLANEFGQFDEITTMLVGLVFNSNWRYIMKSFGYITDIRIVIVISALMLIWILINNKNKWLETRFLIITILGGEILGRVLRIIFHRPGPVNSLIYTFPSLQSLNAIVVYGFAAFIIIRHIKKSWLQTLSAAAALLICMLAGLNPIYFKTQFPSDITAGYIFGGLWLSLNIVLLEVYRVLPGINFREEQK